MKRKQSSARRKKGPSVAPPMEDAFFSSDPPPQSVFGAAGEEAPSPPPFTIQRVFLTLASLAALAWLLQPLVDEFRYHFSDAELVDIGDATNIGPDNVPPLGAYVKMTGVLGNKAASLSGVLRPGSLRGGPVQIRQVLGSALFVEFDQETFLERYTTFTRITVEGRVASLSPGGDLDRVRHYFETQLGLRLPVQARVIVVGEKPGELWRYPIAFALAAVLALISVFFTVRSYFYR